MPDTFARVSGLAARLVTLHRNGGAAELWRRLKGRFSAEGRAYRHKKAIEDATFDAAGYDTGGMQALHDLHIVGGNAASGGNHLAVSPLGFAAAMAHVDLPAEGTTFIDLGSGKGRALLLAADRPFARIVGVEFAREMHDIAVANFRHRAASGGADPRIELLNEDALTYDFPDGPVLLFLFSPFDPPVLTTVIERALASWRARPRPFRILYMYPRFASEVERIGWRQIASGDGANLYAPPQS